MIQLDDAFRAEIKAQLKTGFVGGLLRQVATNLGVAAPSASSATSAEQPADLPSGTGGHPPPMAEGGPGVAPESIAKGQVEETPEAEGQVEDLVEETPDAEELVEDLVEETPDAEELVEDVRESEAQEEVGVSAYYLYAVLPRDMDVQPPEAGLGSEHPVWLMRHRNIQVMMSEVPRDAYDAETLRSRLDDAAWLEEAVQEHYRIIGAVQTTRGVIPLPFGTICADHADVRAFLEAHYYYFALQLHALDGKQEWDIKLYCDASTYHPIAEEASHTLVEMRGRMEHQASGMVHLVRKQYERMVQDEIQKLSQQEGYTVHTDLAVHACETAIKNIEATQEAVDGKYLALHAAYLVDQADVQAFHERIAEVQERCRARGLLIQSAGPWLPYSFVRTDYGGHPVQQAA